MGGKSSKKVSCFNNIMIPNAIHKIYLIRNINVYCRKLKNRVAAQTSRDRKKAKMEQMELALKELFQRNEKLTIECENFKITNKRLQEENEELNNRLKGVTCLNCGSIQNSTVECNAHNGSAVSDNLLPQGVSKHSAAALIPAQTNAALWKIIIACLLYQTFSKNLTEMSILSRLNNSHKVFSKISPQTWKLLLKRQINK